MSKINPAIAGGVNVCAFLDMIAHSEGTCTDPKSQNDGYDVIVGGSVFTDYSDHPRKDIVLNQFGLSSTAAGRYQVLERYYDAYADMLKLDDFSPLSQDLIALQQIKECHAIADIQAGNLQSAIAKCAHIWASLPGAGYGQHENKMDMLIAAYTLSGGTVA